MDRGPEPRIGEPEPVFRLGAADSSGHRTDRQDLDYTATLPEALDHLQRGEAPLGMSPEQYRQMKAELEVALARDGLEDADVRLQGSAAFFYSRNPHKQFFTGTEAIREHCAAARRDGSDVPSGVEEAAVQRYLDAGYAEGPRPRDKMFDQDYVVTGLAGDRSDYDIQISSDTLQAKMEHSQRDHPDTRLISSHGGHWNDRAIRENFRGLRDWAVEWTARTGRDVALAGFHGSGPEGQSAFSDQDWIIRQTDDDNRERRELL